MGPKKQVQSSQPKNDKKKLAAIRRKVPDFNPNIPFVLPITDHIPPPKRSKRFKQPTPPPKTTNSKEARGHKSLERSSLSPQSSDSFRQRSQSPTNSFRQPSPDVSLISLQPSPRLVLSPRSKYYQMTPPLEPDDSLINLESRIVQGKINDYIHKHILIVLITVIQTIGFQDLKGEFMDLRVWLTAQEGTSRNNSARVLVAPIDVASMERLESSNEDSPLWGSLVGTPFIYKVVYSTNNTFIFPFIK